MSRAALGALLAATLLAAGAHAMGRRPKKAPGGMDMEAAKNAQVVDVSPSEWRGTFSSEEKPSARIIESGAEWERLWRDSIRQEPPPVDFSKYLAAVVFLGSQPTGGYTIQFLEPLTDGRELMLRYRSKPPTGITFQAFTQPYAIRLYRKTELKVSLAEVKD